MLRRSCIFPRGDGWVRYIRSSRVCGVCLPASAALHEHPQQQHHHHHHHHQQADGDQHFGFFLALPLTYNSAYSPHSSTPRPGLTGSEHAGGAERGIGLGWLLAAGCWLLARSRTAACIFDTPDHPSIHPFQLYILRAFLPSTPSLPQMADIR
ncbi:hypothetical protein BZA05DRAFT_226355 [Tricharina praecox]|uniref:uncharacterized protein n=1 Tax=Tricharina praecox TaxID=43433 RepID=UPI0022206355|nr:uncharacterized protein BZA05DRAFT_226355 [Tricharina praecox]KAI5856089.1 hypothetical protein BZA05DRAFT_226355 [Tricharina praecox]